MARCFLGLGSNLGDRRAQLQRAVDRLGELGVRVVRSSSTYETDPIGLVLDQPAFLNACVDAETALDPEALLDACKQVEREAGRDLEGGIRHGPRPLDVDVLLHGDQEHRSARLEVPHAALLERRFVLIPLLELDLELAVPAGTRLADALACLPPDDRVERVGDPLKTA